MKSKRTPKRRRFDPCRSFNAAFRPSCAKQNMPSQRKENGFGRTGWSSKSDPLLRLGIVPGRRPGTFVSPLEGRRVPEPCAWCSLLLVSLNISSSQSSNGNELRGNRGRLQIRRRSCGCSYSSRYRCARMERIDRRGNAVSSQSMGKELRRGRSLSRVSPSSPVYSSG